MREREGGTERERRKEGVRKTGGEGESKCMRERQVETERERVHDSMRTMRKNMSE